MRRETGTGHEVPPTDRCEDLSSTRVQTSVSAGTASRDTVGSCGFYEICGWEPAVQGLLNLQFNMPRRCSQHLAICVATLVFGLKGGF